jgi:hypothetical protein
MWLIGRDPSVTGLRWPELADSFDAWLNPLPSTAGPSVGCWSLHGWTKFEVWILWAEFGSAPAIQLGLGKMSLWGPCRVPCLHEGQCCTERTARCPQEAIKTRMRPHV